MPIKKPGAKFKKKYAGAKTLNKMMRAPVTDAVKTYVKKTLDRRIENKIASFHVNGFTLWNINNDVVNWRTDNIYMLSPNFTASNGVAISQGIAQNQRIGNKISIKKGTVRFVLYANNAWAGGRSDPVDINMYIFKTRKACSIPELQLQIETDFFQLGGSSLALTGTLDDNVLDVNQDVFMLHKFKTFKVGFQQNDVNLQFINNDYKYHAQIKIDVTKYLKKTYTFNDTDNEPYDNYTVLMFSVVPASNNISGAGNDICNITYNYEIQYEDA